MNSFDETTPLNKSDEVDDVPLSKKPKVVRFRYPVVLLVTIVAFVAVYTNHFCRTTNASISINAGRADIDDWIPELGNYSMPITVEGSSSSSRKIQKYFDLAMMECFGFAFSEARRTAQNTVKEAGTTRTITSTANTVALCPMCHWLVAFSYAPFINHPRVASQSDFDTASSAAATAASLVDSMNDSIITRKERGLIAAMAVRYQTFQNQTIGFQAYRDELERLLFDEFPDDVDIMAFLADAIMVLHCDDDGYHFYKENDDGSSSSIPISSDVSLAIGLLEDCLATRSHHPLCEHLYIHITEPSATPDRAETAADDLLAGIWNTQAQHLQHMPSHTYIRIGRYHDAIRANRQAHQSDEDYLHYGHLPYGPAHDTAFLVHAAQTSGERAVAYEYADDLRRHYKDYPDMPDYPGAELGWHIWRTVRLRFGDFDGVLSDIDQILGEESWPYTIVLGEFCKGVASLMVKHNNNNVGDDGINTAKKHLRSLQKTLPNVGESFEGLGKVANLTLTSALEYWQGNNESALELMRAARKEQESWTYTEPPGWYMPVLQCEGTLLRLFGQYDAAIQLFQRDLRLNPETRHSLYGLWMAMKSSAEANATNLVNIKERLDRASAWADDSEKIPVVCPQLGE